MTIEKSCGGVVFTREDGGIRYAIIQSKEGIYGFPKGHMEGAETEAETALREIKEETGLDVRLIEGFRTETSYPFVRKGETRMKHCVYFLTEFANQTPVMQEEELSGIYLMDYDTALASFQFENSRRILTEAHRFLTSRDCLKTKE